MLPIMANQTKKNPKSPKNKRRGEHHYLGKQHTLHRRDMSVKGEREPGRQADRQAD